MGTVWPFPDNWWQVWVTAPSDQPLGVSATLLWFSTPFVALPSGFSGTTWGPDFWAWWNAGVGSVQRAYAPLQGGGSYYSNWIPFPFGNQISGSTPIPLGVDLLPSKDCVLARRVTNIYSRGAGSVLRFNGVEKSDVAGSLLTPSAFAAWTAACNHLRSPFTSQGVVFTPIVPYYSLSNFRQARIVRVSQRIVCLKRRGRSHRNNSPFLNPPHPFP